MDYQAHYDRLMLKGTDRKLSGYKERHHKIPVCLGGSNAKDNLVDLTPEEHYVAHQLLVKIYPGHRGLTYAAIALSAGNKEQNRGNKLYGWLRRQHSNAMKGNTPHNKKPFEELIYVTQHKLFRDGDSRVPKGWLPREKAYNPWNSGKVGVQVSSRKGVTGLPKQSKESNQKRSLALIGRTRTKAHSEAIAKSRQKLT